MKAHFSKVCLGVAILLMSIENSPADCFQRLLKRKLTSNEINSKNFDDIRNIVSASLTANESHDTVNDKKRDTSVAQSDDKSSIDIASEDNNNIASESKDTSIYDDEVEEDDGNQQHVRQLDDAESKESPVVIDERVAKSVDRSETANEEEPDLKNVKEVTKREVRNEDEYDEDDSEVNPESVDSPVAADEKNEMARSTLDNKNPDNDPKKIDNTRDTNALAEESDLDYEKQIEAQIQQRIDAIKEDIKREIERKQQIQEIEINNAKFDELEFPSEDDEVAADAPSDSSKRSISDDSEYNGESQKTISNVRSKRRSDTKVAKNEDRENSALPVKKRSYARRVTLVSRRNAPKRKDRSSILIPERGHAEVKDDLPADLTLDPNLRIARSYERDKDSDNLRSARSAPMEDDEYAAGRYRRDMREELDDKVNEVNEVPEEAGNFLFASREKSDPRSRRRRSRGRNRARSIDRGKSRKRSRHLRRHRAIRESSMEDANRPEERDKRAMSLDEDAALEYKESFGGFQSDSGGALGRFKRIKRSSAEIS